VAEPKLSHHQRMLFLSAVQVTAAKLAVATADATELAAIYEDRGYAPEGVAPLDDTDGVEHGITAADVAAFVTMATNLNKFMRNRSPVQGNYGFTLNIVRNDR
jgi:hypothetical protein